MGWLRSLFGPRKAVDPRTLGNDPDTVLANLYRRRGWRDLPLPVLKRIFQNAHLVFSHPHEDVRVIQDFIVPVQPELENRLSRVTPALDIGCQGPVRETICRQ